MGPITTLLPPLPPPLLLRPKSTLTLSPLRRPTSISAASDNHPSAAAAVDMVRGRDGVWSVRDQKVVVLWDLDNKPPRGPPYPAALALRRAASILGRVVEVSAFANRHAFVHLPQWVRDLRRDRRHLDVLERRGLAEIDRDYACGVCGRKCRTNLELKRHFRQLHEREREKKLARMRMLKGKKRRKYKERFVSGNVKYEEAARTLITPKAGYGLASELRRAGVFVKTVEDKPQAADSALKRQMQHSMARGIDWLFLVSDDSDFSDMIRRARESDLGTVVIGDARRALGQHADLWVPWTQVENGEVDEEVLMSGRRVGFQYDDDGDESPFSNSGFHEDGETSYLDGFVDEIAVGKSQVGGYRISAFSEEEVVERENLGGDIGDESFEIFGSSRLDEDIFWDSEEEDDGY